MDDRLQDTEEPENGQDARGRRIARQGEDDQEVPGASYEVVASKGHIKDLPKKMGIDFEHGFQETYEVIPGKEKVLSELKGAARDADEVLLATDPDREGEAIAWHIAEELGGTKKVSKRVEFHEITKKGVQKGVATHGPQ
jgi:DNA topoisomerase-1